MPRPRRFSESATPARVAELYEQGMSTRDLERQSGLSRWIITRWAVEQGVPMRSKDEALARRRYFQSVEADRAAAARCVWPGCDGPAEEGRLCSACRGGLEEWPDRGCAWPRCGQAHQWAPVVSALCTYHYARAEGLIGD